MAELTAARQIASIDCTHLGMCQPPSPTVTTVTPQWVASPAGTAPPFGISSSKALKAALKPPALKAAFLAKVAELRNV